MRVWDWNMYGTKLKKFVGLVFHTANADGDRGDDDATALPEDHGDGPKDGNSGMDDDATLLEDHDGGQDNRGVALEDSDYVTVACGPRAVQVLAIRSNFPISSINGYDWELGRCIYVRHEGEVQELQEGMVDLVLVGPCCVFMASGSFYLEVFYYATKTGDKDSIGPPIKQGWDVSDEDEPEEYTKTICPDPDRKLEITFLVIPTAIEANVEVRLKLKDLGSRSRVVYDKIKASTTGYGNKSVHLFSCGRGRSWSFSCGSTSILPLSTPVIALSYCQ